MFVARLDGQTRVQKGEALPIVLRHIHLFDAADGTSLRVK
jgi:hypothetical protein